MKKFLSLVLALVMTMSLVTISAGATEYKDLTDKDEIQYEEAVAVLNRIGIITGYEDGSFRPETELTRGAAAKIIVSLMIGPEAASALPNNESPYPDVPAGHTFAGVIGYCKTAGYISGYGDGTFKPANSLTGYAFAKMLLGALGYKSNLEGFTGTGWTMNVARLGNAAGLFNRLSFQGADAVNREEACQLALNTLKATMVEYTGGFNVTAGDATVVGAQTRTYVTSNQAYAKNIDNRKAENQGNAKDQHYTVEFGEEHFKDLRLDDDHEQKNDSFGRPSNVWSYKKVTIGTFPIAPDYVFDKQMAFADKSDAVKNRATGLGGFDLDGEIDDATVYTTFWVNGTKFELDGGNWDTTYPATQDKAKTGIDSGKKATVANICDLTDNGTVVEVYVSEDDADFISDVVVVKTQLMEVKKVGSDYVSLQMYDNGTSADVGKTFQGFNAKAINEKVANVQAEDAGYSVLKDLKTGDRVAVIPVDPDHDGKDFEVAKAYVPETVSGTLTAVADYGDSEKTKNAISVTVGGTVYNISLWNKDLNDIDGEKIKVTRKDVTLTLDEHGNALLAEDVGATNDFMVVGAFRSGVESGRIVTYVTGWDISGSEVELNLGPNFSKDASSIRPGDLVKYSSNSRSNITDWTISETDGVYNVWTGFDDDTTGDDPYEIKASNVKINLRDYDGDDSQLYIDKGIKFIYVTFDIDGEVESIEVKKEVQNVENKELRTTGANYNNQLGVDGGVIPYAADGDSVAKHISNYNSAQAAVKSDAIKAVVIKQESNDAISSAMLYVRDMPGGAEYDKNGKLVYKYTVAMNGKDGLVDDEMTIYSYDRLYRGDFASYAEMENENYEKTPFYSLRQHNDFVGRTTSTFQADILNIVNVNKGLVELGNYKGVSEKATLSDTPNIGGSHKATLGLGDEINIASIKNAVFVDMTKNDIDSYDDLKTFMFANRTTGDEEKVRQSQVQVQLVANDNTGNDGFRRVAMVIVTDEWAAPDTDTLENCDLTSASIKGVSFNAAALTGATAQSTAAAAKASPKAVTVNGMTEKQAASDAAIKFSCVSSAKVDSVEFKASGDASYSALANTKRAVEAGDKILVVVKSLDGEHFKAYEFTIGSLAADTHVNTVATGLGVAEANDAADGTLDWAAITESDVDLTTTPGTLDFTGVVLTGKDEDTIKQLEGALDFVGQEYSTIAKGFDFANDHLWIITTPNGQLEWDESTAYIFATVGNTKWIAGASDNLDDIGLTANAKLTKVDNSVDYVVTADLGTTPIVPGAKYENDAFIVLKLQESGKGVVAATSAAFTPSYSIGGQTVANGDKVDKNSILTVTLTAKTAITVTGTNANAAKITYSTAPATLVASGDTVTGSATGGVWTFGNTAGDIIKANDTLTATYDVGTSDFTLDAITYAAANG